MLIVIRWDRNIGKGDKGLHENINGKPVLLKRPIVQIGSLGKRTTRKGPIYYCNLLCMGMSLKKDSDAFIGPKCNSLSAQQKYRLSSYVTPKDATLVFKSSVSDPIQHAGKNINVCL